MTRQKKIGTLYWQGQSSPRRYWLYEVTTKSGGVRTIARSLTKKETRIFAQGWNAGSPRKRRIGGA